MKRLRTSLVFGALIALVVAGGQGQVAAAATSAAPVTRLSDFNKDGFTDLIARDAAGSLWLFPGNGSGGFKANHKIGGGWNTYNALVTPGDVTGDHNADVIARDAAGNLWLYPGNGVMGLSARRQIGHGWSGYTITNAANMNSTGRPDLLARDSAGSLWLYPLSGNAVFGARTKVGSGWGSLVFQGPGDFSGDGRADILAHNSARELLVYRGNGAGRVAAGTVVRGGWGLITALVTPGNWDGKAGNDFIERIPGVVPDLYLYPGNNAGGFGSGVIIGNRWRQMTYIG